MDVPAAIAGGAALVRHFLARGSQAGPRLRLDPAVEAYLAARAYPGNVRELHHVVQRLVDRCPGDGRITLGQVPEDERAARAEGEASWPDDGFEAAVRRGVIAGAGLRGLRKAAEDLAIRIALARSDGHVARAARMLGVTERALQLRQAARRERDDREDDGELAS